jgi:hypothetical protein
LDQVKITKQLCSSCLLIHNWSKNLSTLSTRDRLKIALGGFVSFSGFIVLIMVFLSATGAADMNSVFQSPVMIGAAAFLGGLDIICGAFLVFRGKRLGWSIPTKKEKANGNVENPDKTPK